MELKEKSKRDKEAIEMKQARVDEERLQHQQKEMARLEQVEKEKKFEAAKEKERMELQK